VHVRPGAPVQLHRAHDTQGGHRARPHRLPPRRRRPLCDPGGAGGGVAAVSRGGRRGGPHDAAPRVAQRRQVHDGGGAGWEGPPELCRGAGVQVARHSERRRTGLLGSYGADEPKQGVHGNLVPTYIRTTI